MSNLESTTTPESGSSKQKMKSKNTEEHEKNKRKRLDDEEFIKKMEEFVEKDFYPDLLRLQYQRELLHEIQTNDNTDCVQELYSNYIDKRNRLIDGSHVPKATNSVADLVDFDASTMDSCDTSLSSFSENSEDSVDSSVETEVKHNAKISNDEESKEHFELESSIDRFLDENLIEVLNDNQSIATDFFDKLDANEDDLNSP